MKTFNVVATKKIFIDTNMINDSFDLQQITFVSPVIEVVDMCNIMLIHKNNPSNISTGLVNATGIFNVIANRFINWQNLHIFANMILFENIKGMWSN